IKIYFNTINKILIEFEKNRSIPPLSSLPCQKIIHEIVLFADYIIKNKKNNYTELINDEWSEALQLITEKIKKKLDITYENNRIHTSLQEILRDYSNNKYLKIDSDTKEKITKEICG
ncbi:hypothetical protein D6148_01785, partial [Campylobacter jejuni]|nr:hypothetical protein [Campylobacter jejuni]